MTTPWRPWPAIGESKQLSAILISSPGMARNDLLAPSSFHIRSTAAFLQVTDLMSYHLKGKDTWSQAMSIWPKRMTIQPLQTAIAAWYIIALIILVALRRSLYQAQTVCSSKLAKCQSRVQPCRIRCSLLQTTICDKKIIFQSSLESRDSRESHRRTLTSPSLWHK